MLNNILESCKYVMEHSNYVSINYKELDKFIENMKYKKIEHWLSHNPYGIFDLGIEKIVNFLLLFEAIDYSFWGTPKWTIKTPTSTKDGSDALLYCLLNYVKETNNYDFTKVSFPEFKERLKGNVDIPLLKNRYNTLVSISKTVNEKMNGNFYQYIYKIRNDEDLFNTIIQNFPAFKDERTYNGRNIYFYKLAQLLTSDILHLRKTIEHCQVNYSNLVGCADYKIPQTMRAFNLIQYNEELSKIVDTKTEIEYNSKYEVEIRASMIVVIDYIKNKMKTIPAIDINDYFFTNSKKGKETVKPYHLCRNENY